MTYVRTVLLKPWWCYKCVQMKILGLVIIGHAQVMMIFEAILFSFAKKEKKSVQYSAGFVDKMYLNGCTKILLSYTRISQRNSIYLAFTKEKGQLQIFLSFDLAQRVFFLRIGVACSEFFYS